MTETVAKLSINEIVAALRADAGELDLNPSESRLFIQTLRRLAQGNPISPEQVVQIAAEFGLSGDEANAVLNWLSERNEEGHIVGLAGLSLNDFPHKFRVNGHDLTTWCALDTLYLPQALKQEVLKQTVEIESPDPVTKETVRVTIGTDGVVQHVPSSAVLSIVIPKIEKKGLESAEEIWSAFCNYSHYFTSAETAREWFEGRHVEPVILSIEEGYQLGGKWFEKVLKYA